MARGRKKASIESLNIRIEEQKTVLAKAKAKYETEKETLVTLEKLRNEMRKEELMDAVIESNHTYDEILAFIKGGESEE